MPYLNKRRVTHLSLAPKEGSTTSEPVMGFVDVFLVVPLVVVARAIAGGWCVRAVRRPMHHAARARPVEVLHDGRWFKGG